MSKREMALRWVELIYCARRLAENVADSSASADYAGRYGLTLLQAARVAVASDEESELLMLHSEPWLSGTKRSPVRIRARLTSQLRRYRDFPVLPAGIRDAIDEVIRELLTASRG